MQNHEITGETDFQVDVMNVHLYHEMSELPEDDDNPVQFNSTTRMPEQDCDASQLDEMPELEHDSECCRYL